MTKNKKGTSRIKNNNKKTLTCAFGRRLNTAEELVRYQKKLSRMQHRETRQKKKKKKTIPRRENENVKIA